MRLHCAEDLPEMQESHQVAPGLVRVMTLSKPLFESLLKVWADSSLWEHVDHLPFHVC